MLIKSTKQLKDARKAVEANEEKAESAADLVVDVEAVSADAEAEMSSLSAIIGRNGRVSQFTIRTDGAGPELDNFLQGVSVLNAEPGISFQRTGAGVVLGGMGGIAVGAILNETMRMGVQSGNPFLSTFALACGLGGAALGGGVGARLIDVVVTKEGDSFRFTGTSKEA